MSEHRLERIISNTALFTGANLIQKALSFLYFWFVSSHFAPLDLGGYLWVLSMTGLFVTGIDLGLTAILTREAARSGADGKKLAETVLWTKLPFAAATVIALWLTVSIFRHDLTTMMLLILATVVMILDGVNMTYFGALRARQNISFEAAVLVSFQIIVLVLSVIFTITTHSLFWILASLGIGSVSNFIIMNIGARRVYGSWILPRRHPGVLSGIMRLIPAFGGNALVTKLYSVGDVILLGALSGNIAVGLFSIPAKVATALQTLVPAAFATSIYPSMANFATTDRQKLRMVFERSIVYVFLLALPIAVGLIMLGSDIVRYLWPKYGAAIPAFIAMMAGIPFIFLTYPTGSLLNAVGLERRNTMNRTANTVGNLILNVLLIPRFGALGAALAYAVSNATLLALDVVPAVHAVKTDTSFMVRRISGTVAAAAIMGGAIFGLQARLPFWYSIPVVGLIYVLFLTLFGVLKGGELRALRGLFVKRAATPPQTYETIPPAQS